MNKVMSTLSVLLVCLSLCTAQAKMPKYIIDAAEKNAKDSLQGTEHKAFAEMSAFVEASDFKGLEARVTQDSSLFNNSEAGYALLSKAICANNPPAAMSETNQIIELLMTKVSKVNPTVPAQFKRNIDYYQSVSSWMQSPLACAIWHNNVTLVESLLAQGAMVDLNHNTLFAESRDPSDADIISFAYGRNAHETSLTGGVDIDPKMIALLQTHTPNVNLSAAVFVRDRPCYSIFSPPQSVAWSTSQAEILDFVKKREAISGAGIETAHFCKVNPERSATDTDYSALEYFLSKGYVVDDGDFVRRFAAKSQVLMELVLDNIGNSYKHTSLAPRMIPIRIRSLIEDYFKKFALGHIVRMSTESIIWTVQALNKAAITHQVVLDASGGSRYKFTGASLIAASNIVDNIGAHYEQRDQIFELLFSDKTFDANDTFIDELLTKLIAKFDARPIDFGQARALLETRIRR